MSRIREAPRYEEATCRITIGPTDASLEAEGKDLLAIGGVRRVVAAADGRWQVDYDPSRVSPSSIRERLELIGLIDAGTPWVLDPCPRVDVQDRAR
jgi:hypothetical protein